MQIKRPNGYLLKIWLIKYLQHRFINFKFCQKLILLNRYSKFEIKIVKVNVKDVKEETKFQSVMIKRLGKGAVPFTLKVNDC